MLQIAAAEYALLNFSSMVKAGVFVIGTGVSGVAVEQFIQASSTSLQSVEFVCPVDAVGKEFDLGLAASPSGTPLTTEALGACARCLVPGATIYVYDQVGFACN